MTIQKPTLEVLTDVCQAINCHLKQPKCDLFIWLLGNEKIPLNNTMWLQSPAYTKHKDSETQ